ncbi:MAG: Dabb family protein [Acidimicrobiaceae bacterium]|nr:Dabb family protein [Acidimicrobiaceae bacterium]
MIRHIAAFRFNSSVSAEKIADLGKAVGTLPDHIPAIVSFAHGPDLHLWPEGTNYDYVVVADFETEQDYRDYAIDTYHQEVIKISLLPILKERAAIQFEF